MTSSRLCDWWPSLYSIEQNIAAGVGVKIRKSAPNFMDADYGRNLDHNGAPTKTSEPSLYVWATVMSRPAEDRAIVDPGPQGPRCLDCFSMITSVGGTEPRDPTLDVLLDLEGQVLVGDPE